MATIPTGQKFHTLSSSVVTQERGSALSNSQREIYTMQDIVDTVSSEIPPAVNPTSGFYPINDNGVFQNSGFTNVLTLLPQGYSYLGLKFEDNYNSLGTLLELNPFNLAYTFGQAGYIPNTNVYASAGLAIYPNIGDAIIGCGISSAANGVFKASGAQQTITIGTNPSSSIGAAPTLGSGNVSALYIGQDMVYFAAGNLYIDVYIPTIGNKKILLS